ncbi:phosphonate metabolism protein/1,5-bisphosphokinase (PRPP-forming) PhnN [Ramlibacter sp. H39-3-26]|uniref:phosphonate metabolism protein/1,5-bisphosphokinase (PRPP-forming) PhnN n=1 Tax=Curvibacter soli TaxID=3031331 RepID=UPI0023DA9265|nr:phosphonate metabolism protein/1,5-bisphosphokinase (PRPP-forming) PhnN [Ramlibacter sp. H39-3-26]MDF1484636.1 phosphonate metabolism protein/1,5-bisphosphokinase (PRPP-forming) PhnN [Ramlibacter sp. H39-3-26]
MSLARPPEEARTAAHERGGRRADDPAPGILFFVVGASGVGKDTLMARSRALLDGGRYLFARRTITRPVDSGGEDHRAVALDAFLAARDRHAFLLDWQAHGLHYGLPRELLGELAHGRHVVANGSRQAVGALLAAVPRAVVVEVTAGAETVRARLQARGREGGADIAQRLARQVAPYPDGAEVVRVSNDGTPEEGVVAFVRCIEAVVGRLPGGGGLG